MIVLIGCATVFLASLLMVKNDQNERQPKELSNSEKQLQDLSSKDVTSIAIGHSDMFRSNLFAELY